MAQKAVAIDTVPKETQEEALTGVLLHLWLILREANLAMLSSSPASFHLPPRFLPYLMGADTVTEERLTGHLLGLERRREGARKRGVDVRRFSSLDDGMTDQWDDSWADGLTSGCTKTLTHRLLLQLLEDSALFTSSTNSSSSSSSSSFQLPAALLILRELEKGKGTKEIIIKAN
ncbi:hypothetical protein NQZ68_004818 [Dissostichus eleginoides]|nr:hypothetical protein NQZ68_004818 [Dissostichus eleginoides]